jgi:galactose oxidase-like protein
MPRRTTSLRHGIPILGALGARGAGGIVLSLGCALLGCQPEPANPRPGPAPVENPAPEPEPASVQGFAPTEALVGSGSLTLSFTGEKFGPTQVVTWFSPGVTTNLKSTVLDSTHLTAVVPAEYLRAPVLAEVSVGSEGGPSVWSGRFAVRPPPPTGESHFQPAAAMNFARGSHFAVLLLDGRVLIVGGGETRAELYDPTTDRFETTGTMQVVEFPSSATLLASGKVLIADGSGAEIYDPVSATFTSTGSLTESQGNHRATLLMDGRVLLTGGGDFRASATAQVFDPKTGLFTKVGDMSTQRRGHTATMLPSGEVLIAGGWNGHAADSADDPPYDPLITELFNPSANGFVKAAAMSTTRIDHQAVELTDGSVLLLGGIYPLQNRDPQPRDPKYAEIFDVRDDRISAGPDGIGTVQSHYTATLLSDGGVLLAGGVEATAVNSAAVLDLENGRLTPIPGLSAPRFGHTATRLMDGRVLLTGGFDDHGSALASAELYW